MRSGRPARQGFYLRGGKRAFDVLVASVLLVLTLPIQALIAILVRYKLRAPALFRQERPGLGEQPFQIVKFRTMTDARDACGNLLPDEARLNRFAKVLRSTSLDELPEMWNVLRGDMSLVGPRPLLMKYLPYYTSEQARRHEVRPGVTGWAQVNGRNELSWHDRLAMDTWYVDNVSFKLDLRILARTVVQVFARRGITAVGHATVPEFRGSEERPAT